jgi:ABC-2 type transport system permease protein
MRHLPTLVRRELAAYFLSPMAYLILFGFQIVAWINFADLVRLLSAPQFEISGLRDPMNAYISGSAPFWIGLLVAVPALTMRLIAEERRTGTIEGLLTVPVTETEVVLAKWLAGVIMFLGLLAPFALYLPFLRQFGHFAFDVGPLISLAIGMMTLGMMFVAIGVFFSALTRNQIVAAIGTFVAMFLAVVLSLQAYQYAVTYRREWADLARFVAVVMQVHAFGSGQLDLRYLALHLSVTVVLLYATVKVLEYRQGT